MVDLKRINAGNASLLRAAGSLLGTTVVTSGLGFVFWWVAARVLPGSAVGYGSSVVNAMTLVGTIGMLGLGTMLIGELESGRRANNGLVCAALITSGIVSFVGGVVVLAVLGAFAGPPFDHSGPLRIVLFGAGAALTAVCYVFDLALVGSSAGSVQLVRNAVFSMTKLALLPLLTPALNSGYGDVLLLAWIVGLAASLAMTAHRRARPFLTRPNWIEMRGKRHATAAHNAFNIAGQVPRLMLPIVATVAISGLAGAAFFVAWMIVGFLFVLPTQFSTALFAVGAGRLAELRPRLLLSLRISLAFGLVAVPALIVLAPTAMEIFGAQYAADATTPLRILALAYFPTIIKTHYVSVIRVQNRLLIGAVVASVGAGLELVCAWCGSTIGGLVGMSLGLCAGLLLEAAVMAPTVTRMLQGRQPPRHARRPATVSMTAAPDRRLADQGTT